MLDELIDFLETLEANDDLFHTLARIMKKYHHSLVTAGFTEEQATRIIASQGIGLTKKS